MRQASCATTSGECVCMCVLGCVWVIWFCVLLERGEDLTEMSEACILLEYTKGVCVCVLVFWGCLLLSLHRRAPAPRQTFDTFGAVQVEVQALRYVKR